MVEQLKLNSRLVIGQAKVDFDGLTIDGPAGLAMVEPKVMDVLRVLAEDPDSVVTRDELIERVWASEFGCDERLSRAISLLRKAFGDERSRQDYIRTIPKRGYRLIASVAEQAKTPSKTKAASAQPRPAEATTARGSAPSLAVMPFINMSGVPEIDVFAFGMTEDLVEALSQGVDVRVKASSVTARYANGPSVDLQAMAKDLSVRYALQGNVRVRDDILRITTMLINAETADILWTQRFETEKERLAQMQEDMVLEVAAHLRTQSRRIEIERALRKPSNLTAWEAVMRSISAFRKMTAISFVQALQEAKLAVEIDPGYGLAHALVAQTEGVLYNQVMPDNASEVARILGNAQEAIRLDPESSTVLSTAASAMAVIGYPEEALATAQRAIKRNSNNPFAYGAAGLAATLLDRTEEALDHFEREAGLAPGDVNGWISHGWRACALMRADDWQGANEITNIALELAPDNAAPNIAKSVILNHLGRDNEAPNYIVKARECEPDTPLWMWEMRYGRAFEDSAARETFLNHLRRLWAATDVGKVRF